MKISEALPHLKVVAQADGWFSSSCQRQPIISAISVLR